MPRGKGRDRIVPRRKRFVRAYRVEAQRFFDRRVHPAAVHLVPAANDRLAAIYVEREIFHARRKRHSSEFQIFGSKMIGMRMCNQYKTHPIEPYAVTERVRIGIRRKIDQQFAVNERLRTGTNIFSLEEARLSARLTVTEYGGKPFRCPCTQIFKQHFTPPSRSPYRAPPLCRRCGSQSNSYDFHCLHC